MLPMAEDNTVPLMVARMARTPAYPSVPSHFERGSTAVPIIGLALGSSGSWGEEREFRQASIRIGRHRSNDIVVSNATVSSYHGEIQTTPAGVIYQDLRSTNGSLVRRGSALLRIAGEQRRIALADGDELLFRDQTNPLVLRIRIVDPVATLNEQAEDIESTLDIAESLSAIELKVLSEIGQDAERSVLLALHRFSNLATGERDLQRLFEYFAGSVLEVVAKAERLTVYMRDAEGDDFSPTYARDRSGQAPPESLSRVLKEMVVGRGRAVLFSIADPEFNGSASLFEATVLGGLCAPIWNGEQIIGLALVDSRIRNTPPFTVNDLKWFTLLSHQLALCIDNAQLTAGLEQTVDELTCAQAQMEKLAFFDPLTGLHNRRVFLDRLEQAVRVGQRTRQRFALLYLDLDNFKHVNDTLGHDAGDTLLCAVGDRLLGCVRNEDSVARIGGDEFAILMCEVVGVESASVVANKVLDALRSPVNVGGHALHVTASIGITIAPDDGDSAETLLKNADLALYRAKKHGRDTFQFFVDEMNREVADRLFLQREMWTSLEQGNFALYFQPMWQLNSNRLIGAEALTRWEHPVRGLLLPESFIGLAEDSELINRIGERAILSGCKFLARLQRAGRERIKLSINLSARQFRGGKLVTTFKRALDATGIAATDLEVEITETLLMENMEETRAVLQQLKELGMSIAIDDFGTGYCSLGYLKDLPIDVLKVDRSFVQRIESSRDNAEIVAAVIAMAHKLRMKVVAEGIETEGQLEFLRDNLCDFGQGYLLGKPTPDEAFAACIPMLPRISTSR